MSQILDVTHTMVVDEATRGWCQLPYPGHPRGCPNYGKSEECPPKVKIVDEVFDLSKTHWFVVVKFDLGTHAAKMKLKHPNWTDRQCRNCLYWQNAVRKSLRHICNTAVQEDSNLAYTLIPEAMGVNVFRTLLRHGIMIKRNPQYLVHKVALVAHKKEET